VHREGWHVCGGNVCSAKLASQGSLCLPMSGHYWAVVLVVAHQNAQGEGKEV